MKSILVTGANGQLGKVIREQTVNYPQFVFSFVDIEELDLTNELKVRQYLKSNRHHYIINCAAYTDVDKAENNYNEVFTVNARVPELLGQICREEHMYLIHISTDYIYNGNYQSPHCENEEPFAVSVYAQSKLEGEKALWNNPYALIIRTSWLYSEYRRNFLKTIIRIARENKEIRVVNDQSGTPTYAGDLADVLLRIASHSEIHGFIPGIFNYSNEGDCTWYDFAKEIIFQSSINCIVVPIKTSEYPLPAKRPLCSIMDKSKVKKTFGIVIPHWKESLAVAIQKLKKNNEI
jgi:dTDP-4-dehydrorhamnose reductase